MAAKSADLLLLRRLSLFWGGGRRFRSRRCCCSYCSCSCYRSRCISTDFYSSSYHHTSPPPPLTIPLRRLSIYRFIPPHSTVLTPSSLSRCFGSSTSSAPSDDDGADFGGRYDSSFCDDIDDGDESIDEWEEDGDYEPKIGDGADGGGIVLQDVPWGEQALSIAQEVLSLFGDDMKLFAFKTTPRGYIFVRIDKLSTNHRLQVMQAKRIFRLIYL